MKNPFVFILGIICIFIHNNIYAVILQCIPQPTMAGCPSGNCIIYDIPGGSQLVAPEPPCGMTNPQGVFCSCTGIGTDYKCRCNAGYYVVNQGTSNCSCSVCPSNTYSASESTSTSCTACPTGATTSGTLASNHDNINDCKCTQGYYVAGNACTRCPLAAKTTSGTDVYGTTLTSGYYAITSCHLPTGTYDDDIGIYDMTGSCYYTN